MDTWIAVIKELFEFVQSCFVKKTLSSKTLSLSRPIQQSLLPVKEKILLTDVIGVSKVNEAQPTKTTISEETKSDADFVIIRNAVVSLANAAVTARPLLALDETLGRLKYGTKVKVVSYEGKYALVEYGDLRGWVQKDCLASDEFEVYPVLLTGEIYSYNHPETKKLRRLISDEFLAGELYLPLQSIEFALYKTSVRGFSIKWTEERPRLAGLWHERLKGQLGINIGIVPKTGALIEFIKSDGSGFLGYTKEVHVDESIVIEGVGRLIEGEFRQENIPKEVWQGWGAVWIQFN
jgi:hypothetical protein